MTRIWALAMLLFGLCDPCSADFLDYHFKTDCQPQANRAVIAPHSIANTEVYSAAAQDCRFSNGRTIRAKMGLGPLYPYGMNGGDPQKWLSVWVDHVRVLSRRGFDCSYMSGPCDLRVTVTEQGLEVCDIDLSALKAPADAEQPPAPGDLPVTCHVIPNRELPKARDLIEFPLPGGRQRPPTGSLAVLLSKDKALCSQVRVSSESDPLSRRDLDDNKSPHVTLPKNARIIQPMDLERLPYEFMGQYRRYKFDANNDGIQDTVIGWHARTNARDGDSYFVYANGEPPQPEVTPLGKSGSESALAYAKSAKRILPFYWSNWPPRKRPVGDDPLDGDYQPKELLLPWWDKREIPKFKSRRLYLQPFRFRGSSHFLAWSMQEDVQHWQMIFRMYRNYRARLVCVFQIVPEWY